MVLSGRTKLRISKSFFGGYLFVFVEYLCKRSPKIKTKNIKNYSSILAIVNHRNWLDDSPPLNAKYLLHSKLKVLINFNCSIVLLSTCRIAIRGGVENARPEAKAKDTKKNPRPRPRTAFPRTDPLEAKDRNARGQGQEPRTQPQVFFKKKKGLQKSFSGNLQFIGVAGIFDWGDLHHKSHAMTSLKICPLALNQDFAKGEGFN